MPFFYFLLNRTTASSGLAVLIFFFLLSVNSGQVQASEAKALAERSVPADKRKDSVPELSADQSKQNEPRRADTLAAYMSAIIRNLVRDYPACGTEYETLLMSLVTRSPASAEHILQVLSPENPKNESLTVHACHSESAGRVLGQAVLKINQSDPETASFITGLIARSGNRLLQVAFLNGTGDNTSTGGTIEGNEQQYSEEPEGDVGEDEDSYMPDEVGGMVVNRMTTGLSDSGTEGG